METHPSAWFLGNPFNDYPCDNLKLYRANTGNITGYDLLMDLFTGCDLLMDLLRNCSKLKVI